MVNPEVVAAECQQARAQADTARDLASRLRMARAFLETTRTLHGWGIRDQMPGTLRVIDDTIMFLSALGGQP